MQKIRFFSGTLQAFPLVFAVMTAKNAASYELLFNYLKHKYGFYPKTVMSDFESAIKKAVSKVFPRAKKKGCYFHFAQVRENISCNIDMPLFTP